MAAPDVTQLLLDAQDGDPEALNALYPHVYEELRRLARAQLRRQRPGGTLNTTALVHEAYLKLFDQNRIDVQSRTHFFALSARAMRQILVDHFRRGQAQKRGGDRTILPLLEGQVPIEARGEVILSIHDALDRLEQLNERLSRVVEYKFFGGMTQAEIGDVLGLSARTVRSDWRKARAWLARELAA
jgi:RNA polymerase sigma factor (TIGR02999 family)